MYLAIDYGKKRIGLALGSILPRGAGLIRGDQDRHEIINQIKRISGENEVVGIVLGLPVRSQGEEGTLAQEIYQLGADLKKAIGIPVYYEPEQFSSAEAARNIEESGRRHHKKGEIDEAAAVMILEQFLANKERGQ